MSFSNHTSNYNLPQWTDNPQDKPSWLVDVNNAFEAIDTGMNTNKRSIETTNTNVSAINTTISTMQEEIESLQNESTDSSGDIADLDARVKVNTAHIVDIQNEVGKNTSNIASLENNINNFLVLPYANLEIPKPTITYEQKSGDSDRKSYINFAPTIDFFKEIYGSQNFIINYTISMHAIIGTVGDPFTFEDVENILLDTSKTILLMSSISKYYQTNKTVADITWRILTIYNPNVTSTDSAAIAMKYRGTTQESLIECSLNSCAIHFLTARPVNINETKFIEPVLYDINIKSEGSTTPGQTPESPFVITDQNWYKRKPLNEEIEHMRLIRSITPSHSTFETSQSDIPKKVIFSSSDNLAIGVYPYNFIYFKFNFIFTNSITLEMALRKVGLTSLKGITVGETDDMSFWVKESSLILPGDYPNIICWVPIKKEYFRNQEIYLELLSSYVKELTVEVYGIK